MCVVVSSIHSLLTTLCDRLSTANISQMKLICGLILLTAVVNAADCATGGAITSTSPTCTCPAGWYKVGSSDPCKQCATVCTSAGVIAAKTCNYVANVGAVAGHVKCDCKLGVAGAKCDTCDVGYGGQTVASCAVS